MSRTDGASRGGGSRLYSIRSVQATDFLEALPNGSIEGESLTGLVSSKIKIKRVIVESLENLALTIAFFSTGDFRNDNLDFDMYIGEVQFVAADGVQMNVADFPQFYYDSGALDLDYMDDDEARELHLAYVCRDAAGKTATPVGDVIVRVLYEPFQED